VADVETGIADQPLDAFSAIPRVSDSHAGGVAVFIGSVRSSSATPEDDRSVTRLEYEAHPDLAPRRLHEIAHDATAKWDLNKVVAIHRTGVCVLGEPTVVVACSAAHRAEALDACRWIIDEIKQTVPIWKKEVYADGSSWVGAEGSSR
jgi:molybdopterin synthase catalytic subunit